MRLTPISDCTVPPRLTDTPSEALRPKWGLGRPENCRASKTGLPHSRPVTDTSTNFARKPWTGANQKAHAPNQPPKCSGGNSPGDFPRKKKTLPHTRANSAIHRQEKKTKKKKKTGGPGYAPQPTKHSDQPTPSSAQTPVRRERRRRPGGCRAATGDKKGSSLARSVVSEPL